MGHSSGGTSEVSSSASSSRTETLAPEEKVDSTGFENTKKTADEDGALSVTYSSRPPTGLGGTATQFSEKMNGIKNRFSMTANNFKSKLNLEDLSKIPSGSSTKDKVSDVSSKIKDSVSNNKMATLGGVAGLVGLGTMGMSLVDSTRGSSGSMGGGGGGLSGLSSSSFTGFTAPQSNVPQDLSDLSGQT